MRRLRLAGTIGLVAALAACAETRGIGSTIGSGAEAVVARVAGSEGADFLDPRVARPLAAAARVAAAAAQLRALDTAQPGTPVTWHQGHFFGTVTPGPTVKVGGADHCRVFDHTIYLDSRSRSVPGTACRQPDGSWTRLPAKG